MISSIQSFIQQGRVPKGAYGPASPITLTGLRDAVVDLSGVVIVAAAGQPVDGVRGETLQLNDCHNVVIRNGRFDGNVQKRGHGAQVVGQPFPAGTLVLRGCSGISVEGTEFSGSVMDDVCVLSGTESTGATLQSTCRDITIRDCRFTGPAYRQQISVVSVIGLRVLDCTFTGQRGGLAGQSIDIEANPQDQPGTLSDVLIDRNTWSDCHLPIIVNSCNKPARVVLSNGRMDQVDIGVSNWADGTLIKGHVLTHVASIGIGSGVVLPSGNCGAATILNNISDGPMPFYLDAVAGHRVGGNIGKITTTPSGGYIDLGGNH